MSKNWCEARVPEKYTVNVQIHDKIKINRDELRSPWWPATSNQKRF